jgi:hypothetical protein
MGAYSLLRLATILKSTLKLSFTHRAPQANRMRAIILSFQGHRPREEKDKCLLVAQLNTGPGAGAALYSKYRLSKAPSMPPTVYDLKQRTLASGISVSIRVALRLNSSPIHSQVFPVRIHRPFDLSEVERHWKEKIVARNSLVYKLTVPQ